MVKVHTLADLPKGNKGYTSLEVQPVQQGAGSPNRIHSFAPAREESAPNALERYFLGYSTKTFTFVISIVQVTIFIITMLLPFIMKGERDAAFTCVLYLFGGDYTPAIVTFYQVQRLILPILLHGGIGHIFSNMLSQWLYNFNLEKAYGMKKFIIFYLLTGLGGNLLSSVIFTNDVAIGASTSLLGVMALQVAYFIENYDDLGPSRNSRIIIFAVVIVANLSNTEVDWAGHLGGFITGALLAIIYMKRPSDQKFYRKQYVAGALLVLFFVGYAVNLVSLKSAEMESRATWYSDYCHSMF